MYTDITYEENEQIREYLGEELFFNLVGLTSALYPYHVKMTGDLIVDHRISKEPLMAMAYAAPNATEDDQYVVEELDMEHFFQGLTYEEVYDRNVELTGEPPLFEGRYISIDPIIWDLLPPQVMYNGLRYYKYKDSSGAVNYVNQGSTANTILFAETNSDKTPLEKLTEKEFKEFNKTEKGIVSTVIGTEIDCFFRLMEDDSLKKQVMKHIESFASSMLNLTPTKDDPLAGLLLFLDSVLKLKHDQR